MLRIDQAIDNAVRSLPHSLSARIDAQVLLCYLLNKPSSFLYTWPDKVLSDEEYHAFQALVARRITGEPIAYIVGYRDFWSLRLKVSPHTLIPRPETELLVELALEKLSNQSCRLLDLGTGTGAIALAIASQSANTQILGVDIKAEAVALAIENRDAHGIKNASFVQSNWFDALKDQKFSLIVSNPPYIDAKDPHLSQGDVRFEPSSALISAEQGLADIRHICQQSMKYLEIGGWLLIEHGFEQGSDIRNIFQETGFVDISTQKDLSGLERVTLGCMPQF